MIHGKPHDIAVRAALNGSHAASKEPLDIRAARYMDENPQVWALFQKFTFEALGAGRNRIGAQMVAERISWESVIGGNDGFKINNDYLAYMARRFMAENPLHGQVFSTRQTQKEKDNG